MLELKGEIRLAVVSLYRTDVDVNTFLDYFKSEIRHAEVIVGEKRCAMVGEEASFLEGLYAKCPFNAVMFVTHGTQRDGRPTYQETTEDPRPLNSVIESWEFVTKLPPWVLDDCLLLLATCYAGREEIVRYLTTAQGPMALHVVTSKPGEPLPVAVGAKAFALFIDALADMDLDSYESEDLRSAEVTVNRKYPDVLRLWCYGDAGYDD